MERNRSARWVKCYLDGKNSLIQMDEYRRHTLDRWCITKIWGWRTCRVAMEAQPNSLLVICWVHRALRSPRAVNHQGQRAVQPILHSWIVCVHQSSRAISYKQKLRRKKKCSLTIKGKLKEYNILNINKIINEMSIWWQPTNSHASKECMTGRRTEHDEPELFGI